MNSPLSSQDSSIATPSDLPNSEVFLPPGNPFSLESFDFEVFLPPGNPFSLEPFNFEVFLPPGNPFPLEPFNFETALSSISTSLSGLSWPLVLEDVQAEMTAFIEEFEFRNLFEIDILAASSGESSRWLVLSTLGNDEVINPTEIKAPDNRGFWWTNFIFEGESSVDISTTGGDVAEFPLLIGITNGDTEGSNLFLSIDKGLVQNLLNVLGNLSVESV